jgi:hypothetical protein
MQNINRDPYYLIMEGLSHLIDEASLNDEQLKQVEDAYRILANTLKPQAKPLD